MADRPIPRARRRITMLTCLLAVTMTVLSYADVPSRGPSLRVLQMNLCNSGSAGCYTGRSVAAAAAMIQTRQPDVITLNEVCRSDIYALAESLPGGIVTAAFQPAIDRRTDTPVRCSNGQPYGIGILVRGTTIGSTAGGIYPLQDLGTVEERAWLCARTAYRFSACTTHLTSSNPQIALTQCRYLFTRVVARMPGPIVVGGDFNLGELARCLPSGYTIQSDGGPQYVVTANHTGAVRGRALDMAGTTDHPALLVNVD